ncbi:DUF1963 domain-containing protein [Nonomuraea sp. NPDC046802]|uniref:DUF1963 domain-containing protein n=1 Tax=Nonomuraea sp. NPDC046802 TaxID=3154919 RepID=UPI0033E0B933
MARPEFGLTAAQEGRPPTGRCRFGGSALLEPGTSWPDFNGIPLSLFVVLDTDELPVRPGLLNFFYLSGDAAQIRQLRSIISGRFCQMPQSGTQLRAFGLPVTAAQTAACGFTLPGHGGGGGSGSCRESA